MMHKLVILSAVFAYVSCMVIHQTIPVYLPIQYEEPTNYNYGYEVNDANTGDYKRLQETRLGDAVVGHYTILQPDGVTRTVQYTADNENGFNAVVNNVGVPNTAERQDKDDSRKQEERQKQSWQTTNEATTSPSLSQTLIHHILKNWS